MAVDDAYTKSLLHFDGVDESTTITDESGKEWTASGTAAIDTAQSVFGGASLLLATSDYVSTSDHGDWSLGAGDFTFNIRARLSSGNTYVEFFGQNAGGGNNQSFGVSSGKVFFTVNRFAGSPIDICSYSYTLDPSADTWYFFELVRSTEDILLFIDGSLVSWTETYTAIGSQSISDITGDITIGQVEGGDCWLDEFRYSSGIARHTESFSPPVVEYDEPSPNAGNVEIDLPLYELFTSEKFDTTGSISYDLPFLEQLINSMTGVVGSISFDLLNKDILISSKTGGIIELDFSLPKIVTSFFGAGYLKLTLPKFQNTINSITGTIGIVDIIIPVFTENLSGHMNGIGSMLVQLPISTMVSTGILHSFGGISIVLPINNIVGTGLTGEIGQLNINLPHTKLNIRSSSRGNMVMDITLPCLILDNYGIYKPSSVTYKGVVINTNNMAVTEYEGFQFNSMGSLLGHDIGVNENGIYIVRGKNLSESSITTGNYDMGNSVLNYPRSAWLSMRSDGKLIMTIKIDEDVEYEYDVTGLSDSLHEERVKFGKGIKGRVVSVGLKNTEGVDFDISKLTLFAESIGSKKR